MGSLILAKTIASRNATPANRLAKAAPRDYGTALFRGATRRRACPVFFQCLSPMDLESRWRRAWELSRAGHHADALAEYEAIVAADPRQPLAWLAIARLAQGGGRFRIVVEKTRMAVAATHESRDWRGLADIVGMLRGLGESRLAARAIREADWSHPVVLGVADRLAACLGQVGCDVDALRLLDHALLHGAATPMLSFVRATTLRNLGRAAEATREYERCLTLAPGHPAAMLMLATHDRHADAEGQVARIRQALQRCAPDAPERAMLHYAMFHHLDSDAGSDAAWRELMAGAAIKRRSLHYDQANEQARDAAIMALCDAPFVSASRMPAEDHVPIFIVGMPRTGTTVLERILGNHGLVVSAGELNDFHSQLAWQADVLTDTPAAPALLRACPMIDFGSIARGYLQRTMWRADGKRFLIDKLPRNFMYAGLIHKALPQARIICLVRDPMDSILSSLKELFAAAVYPYSYDPLDAAAEYLRFRTMLRHWDEVMPGAILTVRYEELVREPERVARQAMEYCGLPYEPGCVDLQRNTSPSATASNSQVREPLHARGIGAWRRYAGPLAEAHAFLRERLPASEFVA